MVLFVDRPALPPACNSRPRRAAFLQPLLCESLAAPRSPGLQLSLAEGEQQCAAEHASPSELVLLDCLAGGDRDHRSAQRSDRVTGLQHGFERLAIKSRPRFCAPGDWAEYRVAVGVPGSLVGDFVVDRWEGR